MMAKPLRRNDGRGAAPGQQNSAAGGNARDTDNQRADAELRQFRSEMDKLDVETEEEVEALQVNLLQDGAAPTQDGTGRLIDEVAEQEVSRFTEVGPLADDRGAESVTPGRDDPSRILLRHRVKREIPEEARVEEDSLDRPRFEQSDERKSE